MRKYLESPTDAYIPTGRIGRRNLADACYSFAEILTIAAEDLTQCGEATEALTVLNGGTVTVRDFLHQRHGILTARDGWHPAHLTPDAADLRALRRALRRSLSRRTPVRRPAA
jgi:hypothetical protein